MIFFGNRVFADVIKVRIEMRKSWIRLGLKSDESAFRSRKEHTETHGRKPCEDPREDGGRDGSPKPGNASSHWKLEKTREDSPLEPSEGA